MAFVGAWTRRTNTVYSICCLYRRLRCLILDRSHKHINNEYSKKIRIVKYTEGENITIQKEGVKDICEIIISQNDHEYSTIPKQQRENYIINKKLEIADNVTKDEKFNKSLENTSFLFFLKCCATDVVPEKASATDVIF